MGNGFDFLCISVCIISGLMGYKRGAIKTLISFGGFIASFIIAWIFSPGIGEWLVNLDGFKSAITFLNIKGLVESIVSSQLTLLDMPMIAEFGGGFGELVSQGSDAIFQMLINGIGRMISFGSIMIVMNILIGILQRILSVINKIPIIGGINRLLGLGIGLILGGSICFVVIGVSFGLNAFSLGQVQVSFLESSQIFEWIKPWLTSIFGI